MEQQNQQPIQEKIELKPPVKTNWKFFAIAILAALSIGGGALIYFISQQTQTSPSDQIPISPLVKVYRHGGLCITGECRSELVIYSDGTFVYFSDSNIKPGESKRLARTKGSISIENLSSLKQAIEQSNFQEIKEKKFTGICPTAYDREEIVYTFYLGNMVEEIASCTVAIDYSSDLVQIILKISHEIMNRTYREEEDAPDTSTWQTYRNEEFGFEVRYPQNWLFEAESTVGVNSFLDVHLNNFQHSDSPQCDIGFIGLEIQVGYKKDANLDFSAFVQSQLNMGLGSPSGSVEEIAINGHRAFKVQNSGWNSGCSGPGYLIERDASHYAYVFTGSYSKDDHIYFDQILSTFRFVEPEPTVEGYMNIDISNWETYRNTELAFEFRYPIVSFVMETSESENTLLQLRSTRKSSDGVGSSLVIYVKTVDEHINHATPQFISETLDKHLDFTSLKKHFGDSVKGEFYGDPPRGTYVIDFVIPDRSSKLVRFNFDIHQLNYPAYGGSFEDQKTAARILSTFRFVPPAP